MTIDPKVYALTEHLAQDLPRALQPFARTWIRRLAEDLQVTYDAWDEDIRRELADKEPVS